MTSKPGRTRNIGGVGEAAVLPVASHLPSPESARVDRHIRSARSDAPERPPRGQRCSQPAALMLAARLPDMARRQSAVRFAPGNDAGLGLHEPQASVADADLLARYVTVLTARFAAHGPGDAPCQCRCGSARPCAEELRVAELLELVAGACR